MSEYPLDHEEVVLALGLLADIGANTTRIVQLLEEENGEEPEED